MVLETHQETALVTFDPAQIEAVTTIAGPLVVLGGPGTGKTAVVVERAAYLIASGVPRDRILVLALSRRNMSELTKRLAGRLSVEAPTVATLHSMALGLVRRHYREAGYRRPPRSLDGQEAWRRLKAILEHENPPAWPRYGHMLRSQALLALVNDLVVGSAHNALRNSEIRDRIAEFGRTDLAELVRFLDRYLRQMKELGLIDLQWTLVEALHLLEKHPEILVAHRDRYPYLLVDEFEDASFTQASLASLLGGNGMLAAGNPEQAISSFQGGSPDHLRKLATSPDVRVLRLTTCHRSAPAIRRACQSLAKVGDQPKEEGDIPGAVLLRSFAHQSEEPLWIAQEVLSLLRAGVGPQQVAVLFRSAKDPVAREVSRRLIHMGVPIHSPAESQSVGADPLVVAAIEVLRYLSAPPEDRNDLFLRLLISPLVGLTPAEVRQLRRTAGENGTTPLGALSRPSLLDLLSPQAAEAVRLLASQLGSLESHASNPTELLWGIWTAFPAFASQSAAWSEGRMHEVVGSPAAYRAFLEEAGQIARDTPSTTIADLVTLYDSGYFRDTTTDVGHHPGAGITLTTIHQARGREWDFVFLPNLVEGVYPLRRSPIGTLAPILQREVEGEREGIRQRHLAEEKRLLLVGLSRARRKVYLTHSTVALDGTTRLTPSRYLSQLQLSVLAEGEEQRLEIEGLLVHYRRQLVAESPAARAQALYALGHLAEAIPGRVDPSLWWDTQDETVGADHPYLGGSLRLSASRLTAYRNCPLQFKFARHLALEEVSSDAMTLGTLIHAVLQAYHDPQEKLSRTRETLEALVDQLFDPAAFSHPAVARQVRTKATRLLDLYFSKYGQSDGTVAVETSFRFSLDPHAVNGRIDRIDSRSDGTLEVIDYKTGSSVMSHGEAETDIQLGLYDLAFQHVPELAELGNTGMATYLYLQGIGPRADGKRSYQPTDEGRDELLDRVQRYSSGILSEIFPSKFRILETWPDLGPEEVARVQKSDPCRTCCFGWLCPEMEKGQSNE